MIESTESLLYRLWFLSMSVLIAVILLLFSTITISASPTAGLTKIFRPRGSVASDRAETTHTFGHVADSTGHALSVGMRSASTAAVRSVNFLGRTAQDGATLAALSVVGSLAYMIHATGNVIGLVSNTAVVSAVIRPANKVQVPVIVALPALPPQPAAVASPQTAPAPSTEVQWPIHGIVTTPFGVPELPYERIHTGIDISDGKVPGMTPIKPFKPGRVAAVVHSWTGLGNNVIVDNGGGITSVYAHLNSTSVQVGQPVTGSTTLGYEGTTGASTGPHLHFEIRINGQPVDPRRFISGNP